MIEELVILKESLEYEKKIKEIINDKNWSAEQCLEVLLAYGIGHIRMKELLAIENQSTEEKTDNIVREHIINEGRYSALKFKNFQLSRDNKIMESRKTGYSYENENLKASIRSAAEGETHE